MAQKELWTLPPVELQKKVEDGQLRVFDILRRRYLRLTPEEWVRQSFVHYLIEHKGYPQGLLANEVSLTLNSTTKRCDTVLYDHEARPRMIIEYKAPHIEIAQKVFDQITRYNIVLRVPYLIVSNGHQHYACRVDYAHNSYEFLSEIPDYGEL
ncbi:MAG: type I restriction enzyme HsdR N-terminal domain-containing protein [Bacteroidaceae bacterium]|nr:type I restriction enzyme HsdR N-terminal domain-containing protein [Bacteroidaceae bacterium]